MKLKQICFGVLMCLFGNFVYAQSPTQQVTAVQYFYNTDPGVGISGNGGVIQFAPTSNYNQNLSLTIPGSLNNGFHNLYIRGRDEFGRWSLAERRLFYIHTSANTEDVVAYQYYFDTDPGVGVAGNGAVVPISPINNFSTTLNITIPSLAIGLHTLYIRAKDVSGQWSLAERRVFYINSNQLSEDIVAYQYYFDTDPGVGVAGNGAVVPISPISNYSSVVNISVPTNLTAGLHTLLIRAKDVSGQWSLAERRVFYVSKDQITTDVSALEYFFDTDPGVGNANPYPITSGANINLTSSIGVPCLTNGTHYVYFRGKDSQGRWSIIERDTMTITSGIASSVVTPAGPVTICNLDSVLLSTNIVGGATYQWLLNGNDIVGATTASFYANAAGNYSLKTTCGVSFTTSNIVVVSTLAVLTYFADADGDGFGNVTIDTSACLMPLGFVTDSTDCNDNDFSIHPGVNEICNGIDDNCDGQIDEGLFLVFYADADGDGYGDVATDSLACSQPSGYVSDSTDCIDSNNLVYPGAAEFCFNGIDDNCNGQIDEGPVVDAGPDQSVCADSTIMNAAMINGVVITNPAYGVWNVVSGSGTFLDSTIANTLVTNLAVGPNVFRWTLTQDSCVAFDEVTILSNQGYFVDFTGLKSEYCHNEPSSTLIGLPSGGAFAGNGIIGNLFTPSITGINTIQYISAPFFGCPVDTIVKTTFVHTLPTVNITSSQGSILCQGGSITLNAITSATAFQWSNGSSTDFISVNSAGTYVVTVTDSNLCSNFSSIFNVTFDNIPSISINGSNGICPGESRTLSFSGMSSQLWSTGSTAAAIIVSPVVNTKYVVSGTSPAGCSYVDSVIVTVNPLSPPTEVTNMLPLNGTLNTNIPVNLSWLPGNFNTSFDLYVWPSSGSQPGSPTVSNIYNFNYQFGALGYGTSYNWRVVSKNGNCFSVSGPIQSFTTKTIPDLNVSNIQSPTSIFSGQNILISWQINNIGAGSTGSTQWTDAVYLSLDTIFQPFDIYVGGSSNATSLTSGQSYNNSKTYTIPNSVSGNYYLIIVSDKFLQLLESNELNNAAVSSAPIAISIPPYPDLRVQTVLTPNNAFSGDTVSISYTVKNFGGAATAVPNWIDKVYVSDQPFLNQISTAPSYVTSNTSNLLPDSTYTKTIQLPLPKHVFGPHYIYVVTDQTNYVYEGAAENNNVNSNLVQIFLSPPPDLRVTTVNAPLSASSSQSISVNWNVINQGFTMTDTTWVDRIYLTTNSNYNLTGAYILGTNPYNSILQPGSSYSRIQSIQIPEIPAGNYHVYVKADATDLLFEYNNKANNVLKSDSILVISNPDLTVDDLQSPTTSTAGSQITISWKITNSGSGDVFNRARKDFIFLQLGSIFNLNTAILVDSVPYTESISTGAVKVKQKTITIPVNLNGNYKLYVFADRRNSILESNENNNTNAFAPTIAISLSAWADLVGTSFSLPDTIETIKSFSYSYVSSNIGTLAANGTWIDSVFVSKKSSWNRDSSLYLNRFSQTRFLNPSDNYNQITTGSLPMTLSIPNGTDSSTYYLYLKSDATNTIFENTGEANNIFRSNPVYVFNNYVDHIVTSVGGGDTAYSGMPYQVQWTVKNLGGINNAVYYNSWTDAVLFSTDTFPNANSSYFGNRNVSSPLNNGQTYSQQYSFNAPNGLSGNYYLLSFTDVQDQILGEIKRTNNFNVKRDINGNPITVHIIATPPPDLIITSTDIPSQGIAGQPLKVKYSVSNIGTGNTNPNTWNDVAYLSSNQTNITDGQLLGTKNRTGGLTVGSTYADSLEVQLPITANGNYYIKLGIDHANAVYEGGMESNNKMNHPITVIQPPPSDLIAANIFFPDSAVAGELTTISWAIVNIGSNPATGYTKEGIYFSQDSIWDINDPLFGVVTNLINIPPGGVVTHSLLSGINGVPVGYHYILVRADLQNNIYESNETNNIAFSDTKIFVTVKNLPLNILTPDTLLSAQYLFYKIDIADTLAGQTLLITLDGTQTAWANELYVSFEEVPTRSNFDFSFENPNVGDQEIIIPVLVEGTYYITIFSRHLFLLPANSPPQPVTLKAEILPFAIRTVNSNKGGNTGNVTVKIEGSKYVPGMVAKLKSTTTSLEITAINIIYISTTKIFATFSLNQQPLGIYDVKLQKSNGDTAMLSNAFEIETGNSGGFYVGGVSNSGQTGSPNAPGCSPGAEAGINGQLQINVNSPTNALSVRVVPMSVIFGNAGNMDIPTPSRMLVSPDKLPVGLTIPALAAEKYEIYMEFEEQGGPPGILRAGATGTIAFYVYTTRTSGKKKFRLQ